MKSKTVSELHQHTRELRERFGITKRYGDTFSIVADYHRTEKQNQKDREAYNNPKSEWYREKTFQFDDVFDILRLITHLCTGKRLCMGGANDSVIVPLTWRR
jgi:hypothetical protein